MYYITFSCLYSNVRVLYDVLWVGLAELIVSGCLWKQWVNRCLYIRITVITLTQLFMLSIIILPSFCSKRTWIWLISLIRLLIGSASSRITNGDNQLNVHATINILVSSEIEIYFKLHLVTVLLFKILYVKKKWKRVVMKWRRKSCYQFYRSQFIWCKHGIVHFEKIDSQFLLKIMECNLSYLSSFKLDNKVVLLIARALW